MCRLFAGYNIPNNDVIDILQDIPNISSHSDGFGVGWLDDNKNFVSYKTARSFHKLLKKKEKYQEFFNFPKNRWFMIHFRKASCGNVVKKNSHPFISKNYLLCHNGFYKNCALAYQLLKKDVNFNSDTDSEVALEVIERVGINKFYNLTNESGVFLILDKEGNLTAIKSEMRFDLKISEYNNQKFLISDLPYEYQYKNREAAAGIYKFNNLGELKKFKEKKYNWQSTTNYSASEDYKSWMKKYNTDVNQHAFWD